MLVDSINVDDEKKKRKGAAAALDGQHHKSTDADEDVEMRDVSAVSQHSSNLINLMKS